jgi:hypothetical protein
LLALAASSACSDGGTLAQAGDALPTPTPIPTPSATPEPASAAGPPSVEVVRYGYPVKDLKSSRNLQWPIVGFRNTSLTEAARFTPEYDVVARIGRIVTIPGGPITLFPGETRYPFFLVRSATITSTATAKVGAVSWLEAGAPPASALKAGDPTGQAALSYDGFARACKQTKADVFTGCTWDNASPYPINVVGAADLCFNFEGLGYRVHRFEPAQTDPATVVPANGSAFVPTPAGVQRQSKGAPCLLPAIIVTVDQPAFSLARGG